ncbi:MAG: hypothetical protein L0Z50_28785 [Verrucomicrobiales bacterium]|nr:hypothetical protein [Verrucomicrobiales bacterium]
MNVTTHAQLGKSRMLSNLGLAFDGPGSERPTPAAASHSPAPENANANAVIGAIFVHPGKTLLMTGTSSVQPAKTTALTMKTKALAILASFLGQSENVVALKRGFRRAMLL